MNYGKIQMRKNRGHQDYESKTSWKKEIYIIYM